MRILLVGFCLLVSSASAFANDYDKMVLRLGASGYLIRAAHECGDIIDHDKAVGMSVFLASSYVKMDKDTLATVIEAGAMVFNKKRAEQGLDEACGEAGDLLK